jgi:hypothetical protein
LLDALPRAHVRITHVAAVRRRDVHTSALHTRS